MDFLNELNDMQKEAVLHTEGPLLIVAGAGAGKTKTITHRIAHLIRKGVAPENILAVTFTNKAAREMRERVEKMLEGKNFDSSPFISTFHALCVHIIKENASVIGLTKYFTIADEEDAKKIIKDAVKDLDLDPKRYEPKKIKAVISRAKNNFQNIDEFGATISSSFQDLVLRVWRIYENQLKQEHSLDFDDLLIKALEIIKKNPDIKKRYQERWKYVHVDEYQDTNKVQYELTKILAGDVIEGNGNLCVVGDTDQNIYSWRGANIKNMLNFEKDYPEAKIVILEQNYRSTKTIIEAANEVIKKNVFRAEKNLFTENDAGESITLYEGYDEGGEARFVAKTIQRLLNNGAKPSDVAILYRANFQSRILEEALLSMQIPYQVLGTKFFDRKEVKDIISYIRASLNRESLTDIKRVINTPKRGIGKVSLLKILSNKFSELPAKMQIKVNAFYLLLDNIKDYTESHTIGETIKYILKESGLENELKEEGEQGIERLENIKELVSLSLKYDTYGEEGMSMFLSDYALASDQDSMKENSEAVRLMTVHASKGLEFKYVFITGLEQDLFPHERTNTTNKKEDSEEERRLFYVAITRAKHKLFLCYAGMRTIFGNKQINYPSEFIADIPPHLTSLEERDDDGDQIVYI